MFLSPHRLLQRLPLRNLLLRLLRLRNLPHLLNRRLPLRNLPLRNLLLRLLRLRNLPRLPNRLLSPR